MVLCYGKANDSQLIHLPLESQEPCYWVNVTAPEPKELTYLSTRFNIPIEFLNSSIDPDERPRFERDGNATLLIIRIPVVYDKQLKGTEIPYITRPLGIILIEQTIITICINDNQIISDFLELKVKNFAPESQIRFVLQLFYRCSLNYLRLLKDIDTQTHYIEQELRVSQINEELIRLLNFEKSLVFFTTSLRSNQIMMERLKKTSFFRYASENDRELLEDVIIDNTQAIEMANIYTNILSGLMDAFASIINNNVNNVMRSLTKITIILMLPNLIASIFGMNVPNPLEQNEYGFTAIILFCVILTFVLYVLFSNKTKI